MINRENVLDLQVRHKLYNFISKHPGIHFSEISRETNIPKTTLLYHLKHLKKIDLIKEIKEKGYKRIYTLDEMSTQDKEILGLLRQKTPCRIFLHLLFSLSCSRMELSKELGLSPTTVKYYLDKMLEMDIIEEVPIRNGRIYPYPHPENPNFLTRKPRRREVFYRRKNIEIFFATCRVLIAHKHSLPDEEYIDAYFDYLDQVKEFIPKNRKQKIIIPSEDSFYDLCFEFLKPFFAA